MRLGLISDIHGNPVALEAVVAEGRRVGVDQWWALGDLVAIGPHPAETLELLSSLPGFAALAGNTERYVLTGDLPEPFTRPERTPDLVELHAAISASFAWTRDVVRSAGWLDWLRGLPPALRTELPDGTRLLCVHSEPFRDDGPGITPDAPDAELAALLAGTDADLVCAGHTHRPADRRVDAIWAVNLGSLSNPITSDRRASYVVLTADRHSTTVEHRRVAYDADAFIAMTEASSHPSADYIVGFQTGANQRHP